MSMFETQPISQQSDTTSYSIWAPRNGKITLDVITPELFTLLMVGTGGSIIVEGIDGVARYYPLVNAGFLHPIPGRKILTSATIDGESVTTNAADIWWYGGK